MDEATEGLATGEELDELQEDWEVIERVLPKGWQDKAKELRALFIPKEFKDASTLLRVMLIHLSGGCSLRETAVRARAGGLVDVSDVALLKRLRKCGQWFRWMCEQLNRQLMGTELTQLPGKRIRLVDASVVCEPGATGSTWRLHYGLDLSNLCCDEVHVTDVRVGESLTVYEVKRGDVMMADRGLAHRRGIRHVVSHGGDVIVRMNLSNVPVEDETGRELRLLPRMRKLKVGQAGNWRARVRDEQGLIEVRVCALKKSAAQTRKAQDKVRQEAAKDKRVAQPKTLEGAGYVVVLSTLMQPTAETLLELYRCRWQVELAFKRLKSLLQLGHLKKTDPEGAKAWLQGKLLIASLIEALIAVGERFSPWGYFLPRAA
jgi:hypothetical protein